MARIRSIKPEFFDSPSTASCTPWARLLYVAMWCLADDWGVGPANMKELAAFAFPNDDQWTSKELPCLCKEVADNYQVLFYTHGGRPYFQIPSWDDHQVTQRKAKRRNPVFDDPQSAPDMGIHKNQGSSLLMQGKSRYGTGEEGTGEEGTGEEGTGEEAVVTLSDAEASDHDDEFELIEEEAPNDEPETTTGYPADFNTFWDTYPRRGGKGAACTAFLKAKKRATVEAIIAGAERMKSDPNLPDDGSLIALPATWLNQDRWADDPLPARTAPKSANRATDRMRAGYEAMAGYQGPTDDPWTRKEIGA